MVRAARETDHDQASAQTQSRALALPFKRGERHLRVWRVFEAGHNVQSMAFEQGHRQGDVWALPSTICERSFAVLKGIMHVRGWPGTRLVCAQWWAHAQPTAKFLYWVGVAWLCSWLMFGCVSVGAHNRDVSKARIDAWQKARKVAYYAKSEETVKQLNVLIKKEVAKGGQ